MVLILKKIRRMLSSFALKPKGVKINRGVLGMIFRFCLCMDLIQFRRGKPSFSTEFFL